MYYDIRSNIFFNQIVCILDQHNFEKNNTIRYQILLYEYNKKYPHSIRINKKVKKSSQKIKKDYHH